MEGPILPCHNMAWGVVLPQADIHSTGDPSVSLVGSMDTFSLDRTFRQARAGSFFEHYPRHRKLISLNKRNLCCIKSWGLTVRVDKSLVVESLHKLHPVS